MRMCELVGVSFSYAEAYCKHCGKKEGYNSNRPYSMPKKCRHCGGEMTTEQTEQWHRQIEKDLLRASRIIKKDRKKKK